MDLFQVVMWVGFVLAAYSVVGNDVIQTLGTFLTSNENRVQWWILWLFAGGVLSVVLINGYANADIDYGRLDGYDFDAINYRWYYLLPPLVLLLITRLGIPVSTTFMILTLFSLSGIPNELGAMAGSVFDAETKLGGMVQKSVMGYIIAFSSAILIYLIISRLTEKRFLDNPIKDREKVFWTVAQWASTAFLWSQWLTQDLANIYIYLKGGLELTPFTFGISLAILLGLLAYIFYRRGGAVQQVVREKTNTEDIRSATFVDLIYGIILYIFKYDYFGLWGAKLPMSTTWVFIGLLAGREIAMRIHLERKLSRQVIRMVLLDLGKVFLGLLISVILVFVIKLLAV
jgi:phosphate/sulfate permease